MKTLRYLFLGMFVMLGMNVFAEDIIWQEDWSGVTEFKVDPSNFNPNYTFTGFTLKEDGSFGCALPGSLAAPGYPISHTDAEDQD